MQKENIESGNDATIAKLSSAEVFGFFGESNQNLKSCLWHHIIKQLHENTVDVESDVCLQLGWLRLVDSVLGGWFYVIKTGARGR